jgi:hypothetical protein
MAILNDSASSRLFSSASLISRSSLNAVTPELTAASFDAAASAGSLDPLARCLARSCRAATLAFARSFCSAVRGVLAFGGAGASVAESRIRVTGPCVGKKKKRQ